MSRFVDTHSHGIYAVDDGVQDVEGMLRFLKIAYAHQTKILFMTPHILNGGKYQAPLSLLNARMAEIKSLIQQNHLMMDVRLGSEVYLDEAGLDLIIAGMQIPYENTQYVLVESVPPYRYELIDKAIYELNRQGQTMIIAHPERYFRETSTCLRVVKRWIDHGAYCSINRTSFLSSSKPWVLDNAHTLLNAGFVHLIASDAHHAPGRREPRLDDVYQLIVAWKGQAAADDLCMHNPQRLADNQILLPIRNSKGVIHKMRGMLRQTFHYLQVRLHQR
jgi:protein-tyrosine phosphatase